MISFTVRGEPVAQGSMVGFVPKNSSRAIVHASNDNELKKWRKQIAIAASLAMRGTSGAGKSMPVRVTACFYIKRSIDELGDRKWKAKYATVYPDLDKLVRALLDGLKGVTYADDRQVTEIHASKDFDEENPRCEVTVEDVVVEQEMLRLAPPKPEEMPF